jgi:hypothetical protein
MAPEQAFKILKVAPSATWEQIEHCRRDLVAKGQPDRLIGIPAEKRKAVQDECRAGKCCLQGFASIQGIAPWTPKIPFSNYDFWASLASDL